MEDLISCNNSRIHVPSSAHPHQQSNRLCQVSIASQRPCQSPIASLHKQQRSIRLPFLSPQFLTSAHRLARPRAERMKLFAAFGITTDEANKTSIAKQDAIVDDDDDDDDDDEIAKQSANCTTENQKALATSNYANITDAHCGNEAYRDMTSTMLVSSNSSEILNRSNVHAHNDDFIHTHSETHQNEERILKRKSQQLTYLFAALASSVGITSLAGASVYYRFAWQMEGGEVPWTEMFGTFSLALGAAVGMEYWARWAHRALWHASLWSMHESHHRHRDGPFEMNDVFAIINAIPAIALMDFGFLNKGLVPGLCFGAGLGITVFGIAYMFVHDGLVHRRFPVGPIADVPYFQKVAGAHQLHHADTFNGVPYGLFLGPMELEEVGGRIELEKVLQKRKREKTNPING